MLCSDEGECRGQEVCTSNLGDFNAMFAEELTLGGKQKRTVKEEREKKQTQRQRP